MHRTLRTLGGALALTVLLTACQHPADSQASAHADNTRTLVMYSVPPAMTQRLSAVLEQTLEPHDRVTSPAPGRLLVYAPHASQTSIREALDTLAQQKSDRQPAAMQVHFWLVNGFTGQGKDDASLKPLTQALSPIRNSLGSMHFALDESVSMVAQPDGNFANTKTGSKHEYLVQLKPQDSQSVSAKIKFQDSAGGGLSQLETQVDLRTGHYVVLAQAPGIRSGYLKQTGPFSLSAVSKAEADRQGPAPTLRLLIIRIDPVSGV
ncbi:hypothetical protein [Oleiagrimonas sp. C23AA]|uniref:hypothetical protein n=1 Tax=Oleiagrimonas sp. C23AA TaxID=2719047 RepID=UPI00141E0643|nr:hypothetical protein [Oleiagrimonas sp. C23AA]NII11908.1 hypothetical protein [Oleiagrimonas sp. C23AA]